jgi:DNA polymerase sigma
MQIDVSVQKIVDLYNTKLIRTYALIDHRFVKIALILKDWNKNNFSDKQKRLNSYSITIMLIAYLQHCKILPRLQNNEESPIMIRY